MVSRRSIFAPPLTALLAHDPQLVIVSAYIVNSNKRSLRNEVYELGLYVAGSHPAILAFAETWWSQDITDSKYTKLATHHLEVSAVLADKAGRSLYVSCKLEVLRTNALKSTDQTVDSLSAVISASFA